MNTSTQRLSTRRLALWFATALAIFAGLVLPNALPANAQGYEGSNTDSGVFSAPGGEVEPGDSVGFTATGLEPNATLNLVLVDSAGNPVVDTSSDLSTSVSAGPGGTVEASVPVPAGLAPGTYTILADSTKADGSSFHAEYPFVISAAAQPAAGSDETSGATLAFTGSSSVAMALGATMLILLGGGLVVSSKTRRVEEQ